MTMTRSDRAAPVPAPGRSPFAVVLLLSACNAPSVDPMPTAPDVIPVQPSEPQPAPEPEPPGAGQAVTPADASRPPPDGFSDLRAVLPDACFAIGYHTAENFTGAPLPGYAAPGAWLLADPATALVAVQAALAPQGLSVVVYDAYRPLRGTLAMVAWAERTDQVHLLDDGYIARRSGHNHGHTIDLGLARAGTCEPLDMGTPWDTLDERSHTLRAEGEALENRLLLKGAMEAHGFKNYSKEWWHYSMKLQGTRGRDVPYGADEPDEGAWEPPVGWNQPATP